ncbi:hypothetical protein P43SY_001609 [Pythium insidiosum]|uniref:Kinesin-like protein n=1 Tax=Pythium insidiosum TaxID=114742 RepID=A0AAD5LLX2_PYTIN|nr:hypothetical protein P43SY_001609 [Pythium insidiosum]
MQQLAAHKRVRVCIRVRPPPAPPRSSSSGSSSSSSSSSAPSSSGGGGSHDRAVLVNAAEQTISVVTNAATGAGTCFHFDHVLAAAATQREVFAAAAQDIVDGVLAGYNGTVLAYGQTGAGKTFTMSGGKRSFEDRGIAARAVSSVFAHVQRDVEHAYVVRASYLEVYNESLFDLLGDAAGNHGAAELAIQENARGQTFVRGLTRAVVRSEEAALDLLFQGETNRTIAEHALNASSTRSHCIFTLYVERKRLVDDAFDGGDDGGGGGSGSGSGGDETVASKLHLVDLAGSERMKKTQVSGAMLKEAAHINKSLTFLEQVVLALGDKKRQHVPFRSTPLTNLLKDSLGGNCRTTLVACVWPEETHNEQTLATLRFATRMMRVKTSPIVNRSGGGGGAGTCTAASAALLQRYALEIRQLKEELALHDALAGRSGVEYDAHALRTPSHRARLREQIRAFAADETQAPPIVNAVQTRELLAVFRELLLDAEQRAKPSPAEPRAPDGNPLVLPVVRQIRALRAASPREVAYDKTELPRLPVGEQNQSQSHGEPETTDDDDAEPAAAVTLPVLAVRRPAPSDKELFELFQRQEEPRPESLRDLDVAKQNLRVAKRDASALGLEINRCKLAIDALTLKLQESAGDGEGERAGADTLLLLQLKDAKKQYRERFERLQEKRAEVQYLLKIKQQMLQRVTREYERWKLQWLHARDAADAT